MRTALALAVVVTIIVFGAFLLGRPQSSAAAAQSVESGDTRANSLEQQIVAKERAGLDALKIGNLEIFGNLTADDAVLVDAPRPGEQGAGAQKRRRIQAHGLCDGGREIRPARGQDWPDRVQDKRKRSFPRQGVCGSGLRFVDLDGARRQLGLFVQPGDWGPVAVTGGQDKREDQRQRTEPALSEVEGSVRSTRDCLASPGRQRRTAVPTRTVRTLVLFKRFEPHASPGRA